ncbi:extracellular solute-binding protein [Nonomuraea sp. NPDC049784]|uniref:extracellular solute-binding protein n=1 Tax=Nonomuraea sp. NPDC049784 TaxID=3154361 RepID=UPI0033C21D3C
MSSGSDKGGKSVVTVYSPRPSNITSYVVAEFEKAHPEYQVQLLTLGGQEVADRVNAEKSHPQADVWWGGTPQQFEQAAAKDLLTPFSSDILGRVPNQYHGSKDTWLAEQRQLQLIAYNHDMIKEGDLPNDWADLASPKYKNKIIIRDVAPSGTMRSVFTALISQQYQKTGKPDEGYAFLRTLDANTKDYAANPQDLYLRLQRQEAAQTIWNQQDILAQAAKGAPFSLKVPASGVPINLDGIAKVNHGPNSPGAEAFANFVLSEKTQTWLAQNAFQIPTIKISQEPDWLAGLKFTELNVDRKVVAANEATWINYWLENVKNRG